MRLPVRPPLEFDFLKNPEKLSRVFEQRDHVDIQQFVQDANDAYLHWDRLRLKPRPEGLDAETAWFHVLSSRAAQYRKIPLMADATPLKYWTPPMHQRWLSEIDKLGGGTLTSAGEVGLPNDERYLHNSLMEEAISSSMIEGAVATREIAKELLRTGRRPRDVSEQMIVNNYKAILEIRELKEDRLTPEILQHLQRILTDKTLTKANGAGRFRLEDEQVNIVDSRTNEVIFEPPSAHTIPDRIQELCQFANQTPEPWMHPVLKAVALHFAIGYIHPFIDGNGRTARAIFYWSVLKSGYWIMEHLPISRIIVKSPIQYSRAYLFTETDQFDLTYFNHYHLTVILRALNDFHLYVEKRRTLVKSANDLIEIHTELNLRQRLLVQSALKKPKMQLTIDEHRGKYDVSYNTARSDLVGLVKIGLFEQSKIKKTIFFKPLRDLAQRIHRSSPE